MIYADKPTIVKLFGDPSGTAHGTVYDMTGTLVTTVVFTEILAGVYTGSLQVSAGNFIVITTVSWDSDAIQMGVQSVNEPLNAPQYLGLR